MRLARDVQAKGSSRVLRLAQWMDTAGSGHGRSEGRVAKHIPGKNEEHGTLETFLCLMEAASAASGVRLLTRRPRRSYSRRSRHSKAKEAAVSIRGMDPLIRYGTQQAALINIALTFARKNEVALTSCATVKENGSRLQIGDRNTIHRLP